MSRGNGNPSAFFVLKPSFEWIYRYRFLEQENESSWEKMEYENSKYRE